MAIAEMRKLNLIAMSYDKGVILDALQRTGAVEVKLHADTENTSVPPVCGDELRSYLASAEAALSVLCSEVENYNRENNIKSGILKDGFEVTYTDFMSAREKKGEIDSLIARINRLTDEKNALKARLSQNLRTAENAKLYASLPIPFDSFGDSPHTRARLGTFPAAAKDKLSKDLELLPLAAYSATLADEENILLSVFFHRDYSDEAEAILAEAGFVPCPFEGGETGKALYASLLEERKRLERDLQANAYALYELNSEIRPLKIYCDFLGFALEKEEISDKLRVTERTFLLEAYVPAEAEEGVKETLVSVSKAVYFEFSEPAADEMPPTLMKNNAAVRNFEEITNMYSPPNYREIDPNTVMAFFYSLFLGFIMGDIGYGILMLLGGGWIWYKHRARESGLKRLSAVFAIGGLFSIVWGSAVQFRFRVAFAFHKDGHARCAERHVVVCGNFRSERFNHQPPHRNRAVVRGVHVPRGAGMAQRTRRGRNFRRARVGDFFRGRGVGRHRVYRRSGSARFGDRRRNYCGRFSALRHAHGGKKGKIAR